VVTLPGGSTKKFQDLDGEELETLAYFGERVAARHAAAAVRLHGRQAPACAHYEAVTDTFCEADAIVVGEVAARDFTSGVESYTPHTGCVRHGGEVQEGRLVPFL
jgi:hypothetical protein